MKFVNVRTRGFKKRKDTCTQERSSLMPDKSTTMRGRGIRGRCVWMSKITPIIIFVISNKTKRGWQIQGRYQDILNDQY